MRGEADLLAAIARDPGDNLAWLALADCLEESGDERAELVRLREWLRLADIHDPHFSPRQGRMQSLLASGVRPAGPRWTLPLPVGATLELTLIPPGVFWMGSSNDEPDRYEDEGPRHRVRITQPFWIGVTPITQGQWRAITAEHLDNYTGEDRPIDQASWHDSQELCVRLSDITGRVCRLPTEAEWEYSCRAGTATRYHSGDEESDLARVAWYSANSLGEPQPVGRKVANAWGLHDVLGNVWEWCADSLRDFEAVEAIDPQGADEGLRVVRGGSRVNDPRATRCAHRGIDSLDSHLGPLGCRVLVEWS